MAFNRKRAQNFVLLEELVIDTVAGDQLYSTWNWHKNKSPCEHKHCSSGCWSSYLPESGRKDWEKKVKENLHIDDGKNQYKILKFHVRAEGHLQEEEPRLIAKLGEADLWRTFQQEAPHPRLAEVLCVEKLSMPLLQMFGTKYNIEPSFFAPVSGQPLSFKELDKGRLALSLRFPRLRDRRDLQIIPKHDIDWLRIYFIPKGGDRDSSTIICITSSSHLSPSIASRCRTEEWRTKFNNADPLLVLFPFYWYVIRGWHVALEDINSELEELEMKVLDEMNLDLTRSLHHIRAQLLNYQPMLDEVEMAIKGISSLCKDDKRLKNGQRMLLDAFRRLERKRELPIKRVENVINFVFNHVAVRDSAVMRQISYLTMIFFPASFVASVFGMNIKEINPQTSLLGYLETAIPLTIITVWILVAFQVTHYFSADRDLRPSFWTRLFWPRLLIRKVPIPPVPFRGKAQDESRV